MKRVHIQGIPKKREHPLTADFWGNFEQHFLFAEIFVANFVNDLLKKKQKKCVERNKYFFVDKNL